MHLDASLRVVFETVEDDKTTFVWINTAELLYVVPESVLGKMPNSIH